MFINYVEYSTILTYFDYKWVSMEVEEWIRFFLYLTLHTFAICMHRHRPLQFPPLASWWHGLGRRTCSRRTIKTTIWQIFPTPLPCHNKYLARSGKKVPNMPLVFGFLDLTPKTLNFTQFRPPYDTLNANSKKIATHCFPQSLPHPQPPVYASGRLISIIVWVIHTSVLACAVTSEVLKTKEVKASSPQYLY